MSAIAEPEVDIIHSYKPPRPKNGQQVLWYPHGTKTEDPEIAFVLKASHRSCLLQLASGRNVDTVLYLADPRLHLNEDQRANGAWEFPEDNGLVARVAALEEKVATLMDLLDQPKKK